MEKQKLYFNFNYSTALFEDELLRDFTKEEIEEMISDGTIAEIILLDGVKYAI